MRQFKMDKSRVKFVAFVSLVVTLFLVVIWWIFHPGKDVRSGEIKKTHGLNTQLPAANVKGDSVRDKLSFYAVAVQDSAKRLEQMRMDPNRRESVLSSPANADEHLRDENYYRNDELEAKIRAIQRQLPEQEQKPKTEKGLQATMHQPAVASPAPDPELDAINATLDKIKAIQQPSPANTLSNSETQSAYTVKAGEEKEATYFGKRDANKRQQNFLNDGASVGEHIPALTAVIAQNQELQNGGTVKLELGTAIVINRMSIPAGTAVFGIVSIEGERLRVTITSIRYQNMILPVSLSVYDMDGLEGIYVPGSIERDVAKASADNVIQLSEIPGFDLSLKTRIAAAGIGAAKTMLSKKVKQVRISVIAGYQVLLRDNKQDGR